MGEGAFYALMAGMVAVMAVGLRIVYLVVYRSNKLVSFVSQFIIEISRLLSKIKVKK